jgi:hypothetical protein
MSIVGPFFRGPLRGRKVVVLASVNRVIIAHVFTDIAVARGRNLISGLWSEEASVVNASLRVLELDFISRWDWIIAKVIGGLVIGSVLSGKIRKG